ncbi:MAG: M56 family metallopeptidase [Blautia sp.]|nr:M56 family metallopeptidase [Blautia sp.]
MTLLQISISGAAMVLAAAVMRLFLINRLPKRAFALLWEITIFRLLLPVSIPSPFSVYSLFVRNTPVQVPVMQGDISVTQPGAGQFLADSGAIQGIQGGSSPVSVWTVVWLAGMVLCAAFFLASYLYWYRKFRTSMPVREESAAEWLKGHPLKRTVRVRQSGGISAPLTYGILRPVILMPKNTEWENRKQVECVLLHEYMHICHYDTVFKLFAAFVLCVHWFNPAVWLLYALFNRDLELACDESVVRRLGDSAKAAYARTLIMMEEQKSGLMPMCSHFSKNTTEERITAIMKSKKITIGAVAVSGAALAAIVILFATSPVAQAGQGSMSVDGFGETGAQGTSAMLFWNGEIYVSAWEDVSEMVAYEASELDSPYIGVIESTVAASGTPDQELQSNFGYVGSEVIFNGSGIAVNMDGKWIQFLEEGSNLSVSTGFDNLRSRLINSITYAEGSLSFTIPEGDHEWHIRIDGREEAEGFGGRSVHYLQERTEADDWKGGETCSFPVDAAVCTELYMEVSIDGETSTIDLTDQVSMVHFVF